MVAEPEDPAPLLSGRDVDQALFENVQEAVVSADEGSETSFVWTTDPDQIAWEPNALEVLGVRNVSNIVNRYHFELLIAPEHVLRRQQAFSTTFGEDLGNGVPYRIHYRFSPGGMRTNKSIWIEEQGRWWADDRGQPCRARSKIRVLSDASRLSNQAGPHNDYDELTGQLNRIRLTAALEAVIKRCVNSGANGAFLVASVSNLSIINETFGFDVGDEVIAKVAQVLNSKLRGGDSIGRYSSNKFGIVLNDCGPSSMRIAAERLTKAVANVSLEDVGCPISATMSIGGVLVPDHAATVNDALSRALQALSTAKSRRLSCFVGYESNPERESARQRNVLIAEEVRQALNEQRMHLVLQPVVDSKTRKPAFYECLMRMTKPNGTVVSAGEFIEVAEQLGLSKQIDECTLTLAIGLLNADPDIKLSLNVSSLTCADHDWLLKLYSYIGSRRDLAERLIIEITETAAIHDLDQSIIFVDTLKEMGCKVAIDDFGAGYSSFKNLKLLPVDMVKIDGAFVRNLTRDPSDRIFLRTMAELAENFDMVTVAEFVIDEPTAEIAASTGMTYLQGFHLGRPVPPSEVSAKFAHL